ncbi:hypothetical protein [Ferrovum sp.]|uniref:hypothetical protein n=1 Tax=Ferrovum sp. TaxID=2609467 RepID=UPI002611B509|nr:hypothetical protein [Ferrovum sp.]
MERSQGQAGMPEAQAARSKSGWFVAGWYGSGLWEAGLCGSAVTSQRSGDGTAPGDMS